MSEFIRRTHADGHTGLASCVTCGAVKPWKELHAGHFIAKSLGLAIYFEERNLAPQCYYCNVKLHGNGPRFALYLVNKHGPGILEELDAMRQAGRKITEPEYLELIAHYQQKLKDLGNHGLTDRSAA